jgi:hypothetical protein
MGRVTAEALGAISTNNPGNHFGQIKNGGCDVC